MKKEAIKRFWQYVDKTNECWNWTKCLNEKGYGIFGVDGKKVDRAHRIAYRLCVGEIPAGLFVCHHCDNPKCVRPDHLFLGTNLDNVKDMFLKNRNSPPPPMGGWNKVTLSTAAINDLGKFPDTVIARREGVSKFVIARARREKNIPPHPPTTRFKSGDPHPCWSRKKGGAP